MRPFMHSHMKQNYFFIEPYVHVSIKNETCLVYNTLSHNHLIYRNRPEVLKLLQDISSKDHLGVIRLTDHEMNNDRISRFVRDMRHHFMGDLVDAGKSDGKPVLMRHSPVVRKDIRYLTREKGSPAGEDILNYLTEMSVYINSICGSRCRDCDKYYKQYLCCTRPGTKNRELPFENISDLIQQVKASGLLRLNILGGNLFKYKHLNRLAGMLKRSRIPVVFHLNSGHLPGAAGRLEALDFENARYQLMVTSLDSEDNIKNALRLTKPFQTRVTYMFTVQSEDDLTKVRSLVNRFELSEYGLKPFANGNNEPFFRDNVFLDLQDILKAGPGQKEIYANGILNRLSFGRITILVNGAVHANVNSPAIGKLGKDTISEILTREMENGKNWWRIRSKLKPCMNCVMRDLCPPPGNYEYALRRNNLCNARDALS